VTDQINELFARALGIAEPWFVKEVDFDAERHEMTIRVDFVRGTRFPHARAPGEHKVHSVRRTERGNDHLI
jgi:transposase